MTRGKMEALFLAIRSHRLIPALLVTLLTIGLVGAVVLTTTSIGCGPAKSLGLKGIGRCTQSTPVASIHTPSPFQPSPTSPTPAGGTPPVNPGASNYPPYIPPESAGSPITNPASGSYPPMPYPASGPNGPMLTLSCRLPVYAGQPGSGGFIVFPGNTFIADPRSAVTAPIPSPGPSPSPSYGGPGYPAGWWALTYDAHYSTWLPVPWAWVSPDGSRYAYPAGGSVYVLDVSNGAHTELGAGRNFSVLAVQPEGVYVVLPSQPGLWLLPFSGGANQVATTGFWQAVSHGAAYGTATSAVPQGAANTILRLDLKTGTTTPWFTQPAAQSTVTGFDLQGEPLIQAGYPNGQAVWIAYGKDNAKALAFSGNGPFPYGAPIADSHGLWYSVGNGILLFTDGAWYWMSSIGGTVAGQCV